LQRWDEAAVHQPAIHQDGAGTTFPLSATFLGARQAESVPQDV
jgi:hypothetical protein